MGSGGGASLPQNAVRQICRIDGERSFMVSYACSPELNSVATEVRTGAIDEPLGLNRSSLAENGSKSLKGGRTVREGASMSGTAAADLEREEEASSAGLSARCAAQASSASWRGIAYSENAP